MTDGLEIEYCEAHIIEFWSVIILYFSLNYNNHYSWNTKIHSSI